ncbi:ABC-type transport auxiliary lipoprotein family protein [Campylobacter hepaticus]|nr:ABC-type transport auxiliary lipoprotein family protein [Campylobacter hepaticus]MDX2323532.1 ABC-type transport auxiliary lipoprotein family protein [Campylobacter hepaticus]MDX2331374.1 ABC-type transport auxiliary lipoprotein family protein [Campylobacter hepaticus]MDX2332794.1 ABC-type transport auxiliary lipoprotein family protein [Campylobacter hepaticus]MDX2372055.1 ABC-type transport auxiliary lipoprotein family protein [Campylobacter hepaticus]MDX2397210.1 ABC-type transport auxili
MMKKAFYCILIFIFILNGCSLKREFVNPNQSLLLKDDKSLVSINFKKTNKILKIRNIDTPLYLNSKHIIYLNRGFANKYAHYLWADLPSDLYSSLILSKFEQSQIFISAFSQVSSLKADYILESKINAFNQIINLHENYVQISISVNFIDLEKNQMIAHKNFSIKENIEKKDIYATHNAFEKALNTLTNEIVLWVNCNL